MKRKIFVTEASKEALQRGNDNSCKPSFSTPEDLIKVVRRSFPSSIKADLVTENQFPLPEIIKNIPFTEIKVEGGMVHSFVEGWIFTPYKLVKHIGEKVEYNNGYTMTFVKEVIVLEELPITIEELPEDVKERWNKIIEDYEVNKSKEDD